VEKSFQSKKEASLPPSRTAAAKPERSLAAKALPPAPAEGRPSAPAPQKTAATKSAAAAILALKRSQQTENSLATPAGTLKTNSLSTLNAALEEPITVIKKTHEVISSAPQASPVQRMVKAAASPAEKKTASAKPSPSGGQPAAPADPARESVAAARAESPAPKQAKNASGPRQAFKLNEFVVYPAHGVGQIIAIEEQEVAGFKLELFVISFVKDKMILKVPTTKAASVGMRKLADAGAVKTALETLAGRARIKRTMWSRRAQEYEAKINSGDLNAIAEVVRDLYRSESQPEQSYSERQLYEAALDRMAREIVVVQKITETESLKVIEAQLQKGPRRGKVEESEPDEADIEEAA
jgi:CarD family transcriptional regulator